MRKRKMTRKEEVKRKLHGQLRKRNLDGNFEGHRPNNLDLA
jgi:hypothetical protein